jgi:hypothetical protein
VYGDKTHTVKALYAYDEPAMSHER